MKWTQVDKDFKLDSLQGKVLSGFSTEFEGDNLKSILLDFQGELIRVGVAWETIKLFTAAKVYQVSGTIEVSHGLRATLDTLTFDRESAAKEALDNYLEQFPSFEGGISITNGE